MFSAEEKKQIAAGVEKLLLALKHPEMPDERPNFQLHVNGKEEWSWADILPNWTFEEAAPGVNPWNENSRKILGAKNN